MGYNYSADLSLRATIATEDKMPEKIVHMDGLTLTEATAFFGRAFM